MNYTETDYYRAVKSTMIPDNSSHKASFVNYPSITLKQFEESHPNLPWRLGEGFRSLFSIARGTYHLFYATIIGLPIDCSIIFKTHIFLTNWEKVKFYISDTYAHALAVIAPLYGTFLQQQQLFAFEYKQMKKSQDTSQKTNNPPSIPKPPVFSPPTQGTNKTKSGPTTLPKPTKGSVNTSHKPKEDRGIWKGGKIDIKKFEFIEEILRAKKATCK